MTLRPISSLLATVCILIICSCSKPNSSPENVVSAFLDECIKTGSISQSYIASPSTIPSAYGLNERLWASEFDRNEKKLSLWKKIKIHSFSVKEVKGDIPINKRVYVVWTITAPDGNKITTTTVFQAMEFGDPLPGSPKHWLIMDVPPYGSPSNPNWNSME